METSLTEISERLIACKGFRWMPGMRTLGDWRIINVDADGVEVVTDLGEVVLFHSGDLPHIASSLPDLNDPATLGCLLYLVREAWGDPGFYAAQSSMKIKDTDIFGWDTFGYLHGRSCKGMLYRSEAEALVAALEAAP